MRWSGTSLSELGPAWRDLPLIRSHRLPDWHRLLLRGAFLLRMPLFFRIALFSCLFFIVLFLLLMELCACKQGAISQ